jgi:hypothetical protein
MILDGEKNEALLVLHQQRLILLGFLNACGQIDKLLGRLRYGFGLGLLDSRVQVGLDCGNVIKLEAGESVGSLD